MSPMAPTGRLHRVRDLLDRAAGESTADYGGVGRFWRLPLAELLAVEVHGVRMIAPASAPKPAAASCCCGHGSATAADDPQSAAPDAGSQLARCRQPGRGEASGLVRGLRGLAPFDGSRLPRLPWGGQPMADDDIAYIADWIDDGCPGDDHDLASYDLGTLAAEPELVTFAPAVSTSGAASAAAAGANLPADVLTYAAHAGSPNELRAARGEVKQRLNVDCLDDTQVEKLRYAFRELYRLNKWPADRRSYNNLALIHQNHCQHGWERFLPWHRVYLYEFEQALQDVCPDVTIPYWDWTMAPYRPAKPELGWIIPPAFKAFLTEASLTYLEHADPPLPAPEAAILRQEMVLPRKLYTSGTTFLADVARLIGPTYATGEHRKRFIDALLATNALWYPLRYPAEYCPPGATINQVIHYHYPSADDVAQILSLRTFRDFGGGSLYNDSFGFLDQNPHNTMHIWTGGMNPAKCPGAPDFEADLHGDRNRGVRVDGRRFHTRDDLYGQPQYGDMLSNLTASYDPVFWPIHSNVDRLWHEWQQLNPNGEPVDLDDVLTPWSYTLRDTLDMSRFGYEYVKSATLLPVGLAAPVGRFVSAPIGLPEAVRAGFRQAEVRLHRVPQLPRSCFVRVFLNLPGAGAGTPIDDPNYAGYLAIFGHGPCYGGPGHCDLPPRHARPYDLRPRSHNTPRNHRVDVTKTARALLAAGATSLQITLVVIGADYQEDRELLRLDGVSLDFLD